MSVVNFAVRTCLKRALLGRTLAEERVFDSMVTPIDEAIAQGTQPQIVVSTDDDTTTMSSFDLNVEGRELDIVIEMELSSAVEVVVEGQGGQPGIGFEIPQTDAGLEATLDFLQRQIERAMAEPGSLWADLFRRLVKDPSKKLKRRGASTEKGVRFAARQLVLTCRPTNEPAYGQAPNKLWSDLIAAMRADDELDQFAELLSAEIRGEPLPSWRVIQASLGYTNAEIHALGPAPLDPAETGEAPPMTHATLAEHAFDGEATLLERSIEDGARASFEPVA